MVFAIIFALFHFFGFEAGIGFVIVGYVIILIGAGVYLHAFVKGLHYAKSDEYKKDLMANQPWE